MEKIVAAAIAWKGLVISKPRPARHHDVLNAAHEATGLVTLDQQGFLTSDGDFVSREVALEMAKAAGQIVKKHGSLRELYSEDVW